MNEFPNIRKLNHLIQATKERVKQNESKICQDQDWLYALSVFIAENLELLNSVEQRLLTLEKLPPESDELKAFLNDIFRLFHSLKGGAASFDLNVTKSITHLNGKHAGLLQTEQRKSSAQTC
ncbi:MAG: Hpt domain-containing protein [Candidatus Riflebacteria bacterium]|nr:Hpt domain-containing protein [Candidatus Riflebacteria bacterium]